MKKWVLPQSVCLRLSRKCNARCRFCLAPAGGPTPSLTVLKHRVDWLLSRGVKVVHFCGGEPTLYEGLDQLTAYVYSKGGKFKITTNGISLDGSLIQLLRKTRSEVKVSLHGDKEHHDWLTGVRAFDHTTVNIERLLSSGVKVSVQSTMIAQKPEMLGWLKNFCLETGIRRWSILPFLPRGNGKNLGDDFTLSSRQKCQLKEQIKEYRRNGSGRLDARWLDFASKKFLVLDSDGRLVLEHEYEKNDVVLYDDL